MCSLNLNHLIAFTAPEFQAILTISFFVDFTQRILIEGFDLNPSFRAILNATNQSPLGRHTNVVHITQVQDNNMLKPIARKFVFTHPQFRPWGLRLPISCEKCGAPNLGGTWWTQNSTYVFYCRGKQCSGEFRAERPAGFDRNETKGGHWMEKQITIWNVSL